MRENQIRIPFPLIYPFMKKLILCLSATAALGVSSQSSFAAYSITALNSAVTEAFTSYAGTAMPTNWDFQSSSNNATLSTSFRGANNGMANGSGGIYSMGTTQTVAGNSDRMLGVVGNGTNSAFPSTGVSLVATYTNNTGAAVTQLSVSYDAGQWYAQGARLNFFTVQYSVNGGAWQSISSLTYNAAFNGFNASNNQGFVQDAGAASGSNQSNVNGGLNGFSSSGNFNGNFASLSSGTINLASNWADGTNLQVRWTYDPAGSAGAGARQLLAIDNVSVAAVPEPSAVALAIAGGITVLFFLRRRRAQQS